MASSFQVQIVHTPTGRIAAAFPPGLTDESALVTELCRRVASKGVGFGRTQAHVLADVRAAIEEFFFELKARVRPL